MEKLKKNSKEFKKFLQSNTTKSELGGLSFNSYLSLPIQRIPRYKLLLEAVLKHTNRSHPDYENLEKCVKQITIIADEVNEKIKDAENQNKVLEIQSKIEDCPDIVDPARRYIYEGDLFKVKSVKSQTNPTYISTSDVQTHYLFNDVLIYCTKTRGKTIYKKQINLCDAKVEDIKEEDSDKSFCFKIVIVGENPHVIRAQSESVKSEWMSKLEQSIFALKNISRGSYKRESLPDSKGFGLNSYI
ncbi:9399_t:CDS:2 [Diversispora eburnea]|uniref:9399_t:CDS:1 n=1 Tax=Diversispora eburnea TaxID=1213867 RepID=A0A9N8ZYV1_9GLOM|nr:9399_t:CDS:2 [Diversispora eburnea]